MATSPAQDRHRQAQVARHRLLQANDLQALRVDRLLQTVDRVVLADHLLTFPSTRSTRAEFQARRDAPARVRDIRPDPRRFRLMAELPDLL